MRLKGFKPKRLIALLLVALFILAGWLGAGVANPLYPNDPGLNAAIDEVEALGLESSATLNQIYVDYFNTLSGTVVSTVYSGAEQLKEVNTHSVVSQTYMDAWGKVSHFALDLNNQYAQTAALGLGPISDDLTVNMYVYGQDKDRLTYAIVSGLTECIGNDRITIGGGGSSHNGTAAWVNNYTPEAMAPVNVTTFIIGDPTYIVNGTTQTMDVAPVLDNGRTYVPVRFLAYALGVPETGVQWNEQTQQVTISKGDTVIGLTIGDTTVTVNGTPTTMDVAPYVLDGRTMLPARFVAEPLGATVTWDEATQQVMLGVPAS